MHWRIWIQGMFSPHWLLIGTAVLVVGWFLVKLVGEEKRK